MVDRESLIERAIAHGASRAAVIDVADMAFDRRFRDACAQNSCGKYGACWMCPPDVGDIDEMIARAKTYGRGFFFQTVGQLEDSLDIEGMEEAARNHNRVADALAEEVLPLLGTDAIPLGAGACHRCARCARRDDEPCRFPGRAFTSLEAYGIAVSELARACDMPYMNGRNSVTYFGGFLFDRGAAR